MAQPRQLSRPRHQQRVIIALAEAATVLRPSNSEPCTVASSSRDLRVSCDVLLKCSGATAQLLRPGVPIKGPLRNGCARSWPTWLRTVAWQLQRRLREVAGFGVNR